MNGKSTSSLLHVGGGKNKEGSFLESPFAQDESISVRLGIYYVQPKTSNASAFPELTK